jgi:hypothetical protein
MRKTLLIGFTLFTLAAMQTVRAGWYITEQSHDRFGNQSYNATFIRDSIIRFDRPTSISIINFNTKTITLIFAQHRAYWQGTAAGLNRITTGMARQQLSKLLAYAPEQQKSQIKKAIEAFNNNQAKPDSLRAYSRILVTATGKTDTILGYPANQYEIRIDSILKQQIWVTPKIKPYPDTIIDKIISFSKAMSPFALENSLSHSPEYMQLLHSGYILKSVNFTSDGNRIVTTVTRIKKTKIPDALFQIPPGYVKSSLENIMILDMKNNVLDPKNIAPENDPSDPGLPELPHKPHDVNQNPF